MTFHGKTCVLLSALLMVAGVAFAADDARPMPQPKRPNVPAAANSSNLQLLIDQFNARRDSLLADRQALLEQLRNATAEQRQEMLAQWQARNKEIVESQRALAKQIRDDMRKLRQNSAATGRR